MKDTTEIRDWLLKNAVDRYGDLMLGNLDLSEFAGDVYIDGMKVKGDLIQGLHEVQGNLYQYGHEVKGSLYQSRNEVQGNLYQSRNEVKGNLYNKNNEYGDCLYETPSTKLLKEITLEELAELGYILKWEY